MSNYGICLKDCSVLNINDPTSVIFLRAGDLLKCFYSDDNNTVYRVFEYDKNKLKLCENVCSSRSSAIGIINEGIWNFLIAVKNVQNRINLSLDSGLIYFIRNIKLNDVVLIKKEAFEDALDDWLCTIQCITQSSDYPGHYFGVIPLKRNQQLPLIYTVSADYVRQVPEPNIKENFTATESIIDEDSLSVDSSEQDFEDGGISEIFNQESKIAYHKSLLDSLQVEDEFNEWLMKERLNKPSSKSVIEIDSNNNNSVIVEKELEVKRGVLLTANNSMSNGCTPSDLSKTLAGKKVIEGIEEGVLLKNRYKEFIPAVTPIKTVEAYENGIDDHSSKEKPEAPLKTFYDEVLLKNGHKEEMTVNTGTIKKYVPPKTNFSFTKKRMSNTTDCQINLNLQPSAKIIKENGFNPRSSHEIQQNAVTAREIIKEMERNLEKFKTISPKKTVKVYENGIEDHSTKVKPDQSLKKYNSNIGVYKEWEIKNKFKTFSDNSMMLDEYKPEFENSKLNEKCFADYKKVKQNLISIDEFVSNLNRYKEENLTEVPRRLEIPKTLPSIKSAIFHEKPNEILELPLEQLKIPVSSAYALNKEESEKIRKNLPLFYNLLFKNDAKDEKIIEEEKRSYTGTIKKSLQLKPQCPNINLPEQDFWNNNSVNSEPPAIVSSMHWTCFLCTFINDIKNDFCEMCNNSKSEEKHKNEISISINEMTKGELFPEVSNKWICSFCTFENELENKICEVCDNEKLLKELKLPTVDNELISTLMNDENGLQHNKIRATCSICTNYIRSGRGVILRDCLHTFCFECIYNKIVANIGPVVICPHEREYKCSMPLQDREIKSIIGDELYEKYLLKSIENYQQSVKAIYCKSYKCKGWWEPNPTRYEKYSICPICHAINCLVCDAIHGDMFCPRTVSKWETVSAKKMQPFKPIVNPSKKIHKKDEVTRCSHPFQCPVCHKIIEPKKGILMQCNHACCENCLIEKIKKSCDKHIICPTQKKNRICKGFLNEQAIKSLLTIEEFKKYVNRRDTWFKCKNADCGLTFAKDKKVKHMNCPFCRAKNCFKCDMAHENNCFENK